MPATARKFQDWACQRFDAEPGGVHGPDCFGGRFGRQRFDFLEVKRWQQSLRAPHGEQGDAALGGLIDRALGETRRSADGDDPGMWAALARSEVVGGGAAVVATAPVLVLPQALAFKDRFLGGQVLRHPTRVPAFKPSAWLAIEMPVQGSLPRDATGHPYFPPGFEAEFEAVEFKVDTGFEGGLLIPKAFTPRVELDIRTRLSRELRCASGTELDVDLGRAWIRDEHRVLETEIYISDDRILSPLIGMRFLSPAAISIMRCGGACASTRNGGAFPTVHVGRSRFCAGWCRACKQEKRP